MTALVYEETEARYGTLLRTSGHSKQQQQSYEKWLMLAILSVLSSINQSICYSYAPIAAIVEDRWEQRLPSEHLITVFFISYIPCSFVGSWIMDKYGLRVGVLLGGFLQAVGASLRYFACSLSVIEEVYVTFLGQTLASLAMAFMVNSPAVLSANWFPPSMRATSTSVALNANNMGTAIVYLAAPFIVLSSIDVPDYNLYVAVAAIVSWVVSVFVFQSSPKFHDGYTGVPNSAAHDEYDWGQWSSAFSHSGFWQTLVAFSLAECVVNAISALLGKFLSATRFTNAQVGFVGAAFIISTLIGGQFISHIVDRKRNHKTAMQVCLLLTAIALALFRVVPKVKVHATLACLLFLGVVLGPLQPIVLELGVECAFPTSETTVAALQQLFGNFFSALVPGVDHGVNDDTDTYRVQLLHKRFSHETKIVLPHTSPEQAVVAASGDETTHE
ncbi:unnamed protein product [Phytophthora lilii]|uniref:Unnamed protein product n=1 Tax=Phytophthora lilii TaxID=2077276 RepID=A0A9W6WMV0_9STRA|nr:unnamed protein product [Phytophthora lilii]